jgi:hypothetical protein
MASVTINNHPMSYVESGQSNPRTLVLLSGWAQDDRLFKKCGPDFGEGFSRRLSELSRPRCRANAARRFQRSRSRRRRRGVHQIHWRWCGDNALADRERAPSTRDSTIAVLPLVRGRGSRRAYLGRKGFFYGDNACAEEISVRSQ